MRQSGPNQAPRRKLIPNLFSSILKVVAESDRPLTQHEIVEAVSERLDRSDEELKRQITVNIHDALIYGYLRVRDYRYSIVPSRLDPNEQREPLHRTSSNHNSSTEEATGSPPETGHIKHPGSEEAKPKRGNAQHRK